MLNSGNKFDDSDCILDALCGLHAARHIHSPGLDTLDGLGNVPGVKPTGKDEGHRQFAGDERPVEGFTTPTVAFDEGIHQQTLGARETSCVF